MVMHYVHSLLLLIDMKKLVFSLFVCLAINSYGFPVGSSSPTSSFETNISITGPESTTTDYPIDFKCLVYSDESSFLQSCRILNKTSNRIYIEWENARCNGDRVIFGEDRRISMNSPKADEAVSANSWSISREITSQSNVYEESIAPLFNLRDLKRGWPDSISLLLPIRYLDGTIEEYTVNIEVAWKEAWMDAVPKTDLYWQQQSEDRINFELVNGARGNKFGDSNALRNSQIIFVEDIVVAPEFYKHLQGEENAVLSSYKKTLIESLNSAFAASKKFKCQFSDLERNGIKAVFHLCIIDDDGEIDGFVQFFAGASSVPFYSKLFEAEGGRGKLFDEQLVNGAKKIGASVLSRMK